MSIIKLVKKLENEYTSCFHSSKSSVSPIKIIVQEIKQGENLNVFSNES